MCRLPATSVFRGSVEAYVRSVLAWMQRREHSEQATTRSCPRFRMPVDPFAKPILRLILALCHRRRCASSLIIGWTHVLGSRTSTGQTGTTLTLRSLCSPRRTGLLAQSLGVRQKARRSAFPNGTYLDELLSLDSPGFTCSRRLELSKVKHNCSEDHKTKDHVPHYNGQQHRWWIIRKLVSGNTLSPSHELQDAPTESFNFPSKIQMPKILRSVLGSYDLVPHLDDTVAFSLRSA